MEVDFFESGNEDGISVPLESEGNDNDYVSEEDDKGDDEEDAEEDEVDEEKVKGKCSVVKAGEKHKQCPKHAMKNIKGVDNEGDDDDEDAWLKKMVKGITKGLVPNTMVEHMKEGGVSKKKKEKAGVLLRGAVTVLRYESQEGNNVTDNGGWGDNPKEYVLSYH